MPSSEPTGQPPETKTELCLMEDRPPEVLITFRQPIRRARSLGCSARMVMTPGQARDLYRRLGRTLSVYRQMERAPRQGGSNAE